MNQYKHSLLPRRILFGLLVVGAAAAVFYAGVCFGVQQTNGFWKFAKDQGVNVLFGVVGGLATSAFIWYLTITGKQIVASWNPQNQYIDGLWEERYALDQSEPHQEQRLILSLKQDGGSVTGRIDAADTDQCPELKRHGPRSFSVTGISDGTYVSLDAVLDGREVGHTVYLLKRRQVTNVMDGWTVFHNLNDGSLEATRTQLVRRERADIMSDLRSKKPVPEMID